ncbi:MAG: hypothetical protein A2W93_07055 [Bacteroidetes bacterium GWF2_43_63]|nr:MAG: hypothetical protein A2W94_09825 [Bacteroidetes bacterium GWE2_42_42]OFY53768.1 MAG: hypothetical protein A2W93_07055 [Bacteroidetes bacterium GWF2_43_63]HCB61053.1 hypothetical protein [Bacteroidales bacterium]HCY24175.1 hypothetical protein [Bacteroidales bacterium]
MKIFHAGDKVRFISSKGSGIVTSVKNNIVSVLIEDGFEIPVEASDLVVIEPQEGNKNPFLKKDEFTKLQASNKSKNAVEQKSKEQDLASDQVSSDVDADKKNRHGKSRTETIINGVYLAFMPENQEVLISGNMDVYLINYSKWQVAFHILKADPSKGFESIATGLMEKGDATIIESLSEYDLKNWSRLRLQLHCFDSKNGQLFDSELIDLEIKTSKFIKEDIYDENPFFDELAHVIFVHDLSHPPLYNSTPTTNTEISEKKTSSVIDRYMIDRSNAEVDLHIEKLRSDHKTMRKDDIMPIQIAFFRQCLEAAIAKKLARIVFIHGVGVGLLKKELTDILKTYADLEFEDASILKYGIGATEVRFVRH